MSRYFSENSSEQISISYKYWEKKLWKSLFGMGGKKNGCYALELSVRSCWLAVLSKSSVSLIDFLLICSTNYCEWVLKSNSYCWIIYFPWIYFQECLSWIWKRKYPRSPSVSPLYGFSYMGCIISWHSYRLQSFLCSLLPYSLSECTTWVVSTSARQYFYLVT